MLARQRDPGTLVCTNCNRLGHTRGQCPQPCRIPVGLTDARIMCGGIAPNHNPACLLSKESVARRKAAQTGRRQDRASARPPPAYQRQRQRPNRAAQIAGARANLAQVKTVRKQAEDALVRDESAEGRAAHMAQIVELNQSHDEIVVAMAQLQEDHDPLGPAATSEHDFELSAENRVASAAHVADADVHAPVTRETQNPAFRLWESPIFGTWFGRLHSNLIFFLNA